MMALTLLTAYLLSTVGTAALAIGCDCPHSFYHKHSHSCIKVCCSGHCGHSHDHDSHNGHDYEGSQQLAADDECCHHNHSTEIALYTADSDDAAALRTVSAPTDAAACDPCCPPTALTACIRAFAERRCPPEQRCQMRCRPLRAPPVCA